MRATNRLVLIIAVLCVTPAFAAFDYIETWPTDANSEGWLGLVGISVAHNDANDTLGFSSNSTDFGVGYVAADITSSGGAFVGDLTAAGVVSYEFDLLLDQGSDLDRMSLQILTYHAPYERWRFPLTGITDGAFHHYSVPVTSSAGWIQGLGTQSFAFMLANVDSVRLRMYDGDDERTGVSGQLDNFGASVPEPGTFALAGLGLLALGIKLRRRED